MTVNKISAAAKHLLLILPAAALLFLPVTVCAAAPAAASDEISAADMLALTDELNAAAWQVLDDRYDAYFTYYTADEYRLMTDSYNGTFGGIGITMTVNDDNNVCIYNILDQGPARTADIQVGDVIVAVDGENLLGHDTNDAALLIRGELGSSVTVTLRREGREDFDVTLTREQITEVSVEAEMIEEAPDTAYVRISEFSTDTVNQFAELLNALMAEHTVSNIIFDLRSNGGGAFSAAINLANLFVPSGHTIVSESTADGAEVYRGNSGLLGYCRIYVLQNEWSASSSEVLTGALRDEAGAVIIGSTSYGKGITQVMKEFRSVGRALRFTRSRYYTPSGYDLHGVGIDPDYEISLPEGITSAEYYSTDPALNPHLAKAVSLICEQN